MSAPKPRKRKPDDLVTASDVAAELGWPTVRAESLIRKFGRRGELEILWIPEFRCQFVRWGQVQKIIQSATVRGQS
jgi:hypothetical protein